MFCFKCGAELPDVAKFCGKCGVKMPVVEYDAPKASAAPTEVLLEREVLDKTEILTDEKTELLLESEASEKTEILSDENAEKTEILSPQETAENDVPKIEKQDGVVPLKPGEMLGGVYRVVDVIGKGGFGYVYKAYHTRLQQDVVIKQIHRVSKGVSNRTEADVLKRIKHTYLPQVHDFIEQDGTAFTIMDFVTGTDIEKLMRHGRKFSQKECVKIAVQLCEAVKYLHSCDPPIIHSDIKPENIMLTENGDICLIDMNVSLIFDSSVSLIGGTPDFAPPEQFGVPLSEIRNGVSKLTLIKKDTPKIDERSDVYSIGASLYYIALGKTPAIDYSSNPAADFAAAGISDSLATIVAKAMSLNPARRYKSASEMLTALNNIGKLDRRYKLLRLQRAVVTAFCAATVFLFISISRLGYVRMKDEHEDKYQTYVLQIENCIRQEDYDLAEDTIAAAKELEPSRIEPYLNEAKLLSINRDYEECMEYPSRYLTPDISNNEKNDDEDFAQIYEIAANGAFELEFYKEAIQSFQQALRFSPKSVECYRDMTISYARLGDINSAEESLEKAMNLGISDDRLSLMQGEISAAKGEFSKAFESFRNAIGTTNNDYVRFRALLACDNAAIANNKLESSMHMIILLESEINNVSAEYSGTVREMLANEYAICGQLLEDDEYYRKAADCYEKLLDERILSYQLEKNYFNILFSQLGEYEKCGDLLDKMQTENPSDYWVLMSRAYLEITVQNQISDQTKRDYRTAYESYLQAEELYKNYTQNGKSDPNMDTLRASIDSLKNYGWIKED